MLTFSGREFDIETFDWNSVDIEDISHPLSLQTRYNGHCNDIYTISEHSLLVAKILALKGANTETQMYGLLHDASEAYICDIPTPMKKKLPDYYVWEEKIQNAILKYVSYRIGNFSYSRMDNIKWLDKVDTELVKKIDAAMVPVEMAQLFTVQYVDLVFKEVMLLPTSEFEIRGGSGYEFKREFDKEFYRLLEVLKERYKETPVEGPTV